MLSGLRTIFFETSLRWLPLEGYGIKKDAIRRLYNKMFEPGGYRYENLDLQADPPVLSSKHPGGGFSACRFGASSLTIEEKKSPSTNVQSFIEAVTTVLGGMNEEDVPLGFFLQQCRVQCLAQPSNVEHSLELLTARVANVYDNVNPFGRPPSFFGVRFRFAPFTFIDREQEAESGGEGATSTEAASGQPASTDVPREMTNASRSIEKKGFVDLRFETHTEDLSQVWMEVTATYPEAEPLLLRDTRITDNIRETHTFLAEQGKHFLDQFDTKQ